MDNKAVLFEKIKITSAQGISPDNGFELPLISPGVNLVFGPNGSGKSTTALVIQELLWPGKTGLSKPTVYARFSLEDATWSVKIDAGHAEIENMLQAGSTANIGPAENSSRYMLALHELITDDNADFAKIITAESQGGFDLDAAKKRLCFVTPSRKPSKLIKKARDAREEVREARAVQERIARKEQLLPELRNKRNKAIDAEKRISLLEQVEEFQIASSQCKHIQEQLSLFPSGIALLAGTEEESLSRLSIRQVELEKRNTTARQDKVNAIRSLMALKLPDKLLEGDTIAVVRGLLKNLVTLEKKIDEQSRISIYSRSEADTAEDRISNNISPNLLSSIDSALIEELSLLARQSDVFRGEETALIEKKRLLTGALSHNISDYRIEQIREGISSLKLWLKTPDPSEKKQVHSQSPLITSVSILTVLSIVLGLSYTPLWILLAIPAVLLLLWGKPENIDRESISERNVYASNYKKTTLPEPNSWENAEVLSMLQSLVDLTEVKAQQNRLAQVLSDLAKDELALQTRKTELDQQKKQLEEKIGFAVAIDTQWLPLLVQNISRWQKHSASAEAAEQLLISLKSDRQNLLKAITEELTPFGYSAILSADHADEVIQALSLRFGEYHSSVQKRDTADSTVSNIQSEIDKIEAERLAIFNKLNLDRTQTATVKRWFALLPEFTTLQKELTSKEAIRKNRRERLAGNEKLLSLDHSDISLQIRELREEADNRDEFTGKISDICRSIENAQIGHLLSDALSREDSVLSDLDNLREETSLSITGELLIDWVREVAIDRARPLVFKRACELVSEFTNGHLQLKINDRSNPPQFKASVNGDHPRSVSELSTGERVQLLIAIRTAFLEQNEPVRLPLLLDEALGTSDDLRAGLIIDAVIKIAEMGRQIFYFTAQQDEISKWITKLKEAGTPYMLTDLGNLRKKQITTSFPLEITPSQAIDVPSPVGMTHEEYGKILEVPNINPLADSQDRLHLWHLIEDNNLLYSYLSYRIEEWGQLKTLIEHGGEKLVNAERVEIDRIYATAKAVEAACAGWRIGRGKQVNRRVLQDSGCVSDSFIETVSELSESLNGSAAGIILGLKNRVIPRWLTTKTDELQSYLENNGYLSQDTVLTSQEIRIRVLASVAEAVSRQMIDSSLIERIVGSLPL